MPKVLPSIFSYESMKAKWNEDNPDEPYFRRADLETGRYALDEWIIRVNDEGKTIATTGWKEYSSHIVVGGTKSIKKTGGGHMPAMAATRKTQTAGKPLLTAFLHANGDNQRWITDGKGAGWVFPNDSLFQEYSQLIPKEVMDDWLSVYPDIVAIHANDSLNVAKAFYFDDVNGDWFNVIKKGGRYGR